MLKISLIILLLLFIFPPITFSQKAEKELENSIQDTITMTLGTGLKLPIVILLDTCPVPQTIKFTQKLGGFYTVFYKDGSQKEINLLPPETTHLEQEAPEAQGGH
jgi:hypothetical protein